MASEVRLSPPQGRGRAFSHHKADPHERTDLAPAYPALVARLRGEMKAAGLDCAAADRAARR